MSSNNRIILDGCLERFKIENELSLSPSQIFELFSLMQIVKATDLTFEEISSSIVDGGNDGGIDSIIIMVDDNSPLTLEDMKELHFNQKTEAYIILSQCKKESSFKELQLDRLITSIPVLFNLESDETELLQRFNANLVEKVLIAHEVWKKCSVSGGKLKVIYNYCCHAENIEVNSVFENKVQQLKTITKKTFSNAEVEYWNYSAQELLRFYQTQKNQRLSLKYKNNPLSTEYEQGGFGYVGTVKLGEYKFFLQDNNGNIRDELFESNIRHFQGITVDVNKKIKSTIDEPGNEDFWWLNNGITIIAENPSLVGTTLSIDNVQIVNGLQTSYSIFYNHSGTQSDSRSVLVKVIISDDKAIIDHIIASTNSQNPVSPTLLRATDDTQRELELFFLNKGYYYDRRKNYYKNQGKPVNKIFSIQTTAQAIETLINHNPHSARSKPTTLIKDDKTYGNIFNPNRDFNAYLNATLIVKLTSENFWKILDPGLKSHLSNFKLHLARLVAGKIFGNTKYTLENLINFKIDDYKEEYFSVSVEMLADFLDNYLMENSSSNLINVAKTKAFTDYMISEAESFDII